MTLRVLDTGLAPARWNVAFSATLLDGVDAGRIPPTLRLYRFPPTCVLGRNQDAAIELDLEACHREGVALARRVTGGGAVVMGPGVLAYDLILPVTRDDAFGLARRASEALVAALGRLGFEAALATPGSVGSGGRKLSGSAGRFAKNAALHQATLILDLAGAAPLALLRRRTEGGKPTPDPTHRVTSLTALRGTAPDLAEVQASLTAAMAGAFGLDARAGMPDAEERAGAETRLAELGRDDYVLGAHAEAA